MTDLSPAAASIVQAFDDRYELLGGFDDNWQELCIAAALRAAADQVVPEPQGDPTTWTQCAFLGVREDLLAIAAELEANDR
jgi:hypothetical protein